MDEKKSYITVNGKRFAVWYQLEPEAVFFCFAGEREHAHRAYGDGYAYSHGGALYCAAVDRAAELGFLV